eukprot:347386-Pelagomonas_calceolata.AAC.3
MSLIARSKVPWSVQWQPGETAISCEALCSHGQSAEAQSTKQKGIECTALLLNIFPQQFKN